MLEKRLAALDGGAAALAFASGQGAITASLATIVHSGQNFISATSLYGGTWTLLTQTFSKLSNDGQGAIVGFGIKGGKDAGAKLINSVKLFSHLADIGDAKSLIIHLATTTHSQLTPEEQVQTGVIPEYVRLSVGIEDVSDIIADLDQALRQSQA